VVVFLLELAHIDVAEPPDRHHWQLPKQPRLNVEL
jgi:hypothetical protein